MPHKRTPALKRERATKIVATVGPASNSEEKLKARCWPASAGWRRR